MKNILHISDIHVSDIPTTGMSENVLRSLLPSLVDDLKTLPKVDTIFITGDIANSGQLPEYEIFLNQFLTPLLSELGLNNSRVFIVPGNHDANRRDWKASDQIIRDGLISNPQQSSVEGIIKEKINDPNFTWSENYTSLRDKLTNNNSNCIFSNKFFAAYEVDGVGIGCINSAWLSNKDDEKSLFVGEWQFLEIIKVLKPYEQKVILMHHPLDWLHPEDKSILMNRLHSSKISCLFYGHMHEFWMTKESIFSEDTVLKLQAGRLDKSKNPSLCGYSLVALHEQNTFESGEIYFRKFDPNKNKFRPWTERINDGKASYSLKDALPFSPEQFCECCNELISEIEFDLLCNTGLPSNQRKKLSEIFVLPALAAENEEYFTEDSFDPKRNAEITPKYHTLNALADSIESLVILGGENSGKTTLAKRISLYYLSNQASLNMEKVVFYLDLNGKSFRNVKRVQTDLLSFYFKDGVEPTHQAKIERKLKSPGAVIVLDSIESLDTPSLKIISEYISASPARFVIFGQLSARPILREMSDKISHAKKFNHISIKSLKRNHLKELVGKWNPSTNSTQTTKVASNALKVVSNTGMANNPFVYTMLLSIHERKTTSNRTYMHEADLIENFIEIIMQKHVVPLGNVPLYKDVLLFLGYLSKHMNENSSYLISHNVLLQKALDFNKQISQDFKAESYIDPILRSGIMRKIGDQYKFSQICFFNYVLANFISIQGTDYETLDAQLDFIRFDKVIEYVSAIKSDPKLLDYLAKKMDVAWDALIASENISDLKNAECEILNCAGHDIIDMIKQDMLESSFNSKQDSELEHNEKLDHADPLREQPITEIKVSQLNVKPIVLFLETLSLYARAFRSAEQILDANATQQHFTNIFNVYMNSIAFNIRAFDRQGRPIIIEHIKSILEYERIEQGKRGEIEAQVHAFINFVIAALPNSGVAMMSSDFFNHRQRQRIKTHRVQTNSNLEKILLTYCLCELDDVNVYNELKSQIYEKRHESSSLILKLFEFVFFNFNISNIEKENLKKLAEKMVKDRKTSQLFKNYTVVSQKMAQNVGIIDE